MLSEIFNKFAQHRGTMIKLIVTDIDGTLLDNDKNLPQDFWETEEKLSAKNILFAAASGRQFYNLQELFSPISERCVFIAENGAMVMFRGECLSLTTIKKEHANDVIKLARTIKDTDIILCGIKSAYYENNSGQLLKYASNYYKKITYAEDLTKVEDEFLKIAICDYSGPRTNSYPLFHQMAAFLKVVVSGRRWIDIMNLHTNKGAAVRQIQKKFGIAIDETMVFGDFLNDLEMMQAGTYSYAMLNAEPEIKAASKYTTQYSNNENGVLKTIQSIILHE